jgi:hypothetical protein
LCSPESLTGSNCEGKESMNRVVGIGDRNRKSESEKRRRKEREIRIWYEESVVLWISGKNLTPPHFFFFLLLCDVFTILTFLSSDSEFSEILKKKKNSVEKARIK